MEISEITIKAENDNKQLNVLDEELEECSCEPMTGYFRDGFCRTDKTDAGTHTVCAVITDEFLQFTKERGNDLQTAAPHFNFPGLKAGDKWCLCAMRWKEAYDNDAAPKVLLAATNKKTLKIIDLEILKEFSVD